MRMKGAVAQLEPEEPKRSSYQGRRRNYSFVNLEWFHCRAPLTLGQTTTGALSRKAHPKPKRPNQQHLAAVLPHNTERSMSATGADTDQLQHTGGQAGEGHESTLLQPKTRLAGGFDDDNSVDESMFLGESPRAAEGSMGALDEDSPGV